MGIILLPHRSSDPCRESHWVPCLVFAVHKLSGSPPASPPGLPSATFPAVRHPTRPIVIVRQGLLWLSERRGVFNFVRRNGVARKFASRFVAGETIDEGVEAARELARRGITSSLDLLGESVTAEAEAVAARDQYLTMLDHMAAAGVEVNVSVK